MKIIISPAKSLDFQTAIPSIAVSKALFLEKTQKIQQTMQKKSIKSIAKLMNLSQKLSELNWHRYQNFDKKDNPKRQAIFAFKGDVYLGLDVHSLKKEQILNLQQNLRILSGFYGLLYPLDEIQPHRLEMGTMLRVVGKKNLYDFWKKEVSKRLKEELQPDEPLINLASNEYFQVIKQDLIPNSIITPIFQDQKNGNYKVISFFAKKARGMMVRFIVENKIDKIENLKFFSYHGYQFSLKNSTTTRLVFRRKEKQVA